MTQWGLDTLFNPAKRHMDEEKRRLQSTREEVGDNSGGKRIDLDTGKVVISRTASDDDEAAETKTADDKRVDDSPADKNAADKNAAAGKDAGKAPSAAALRAAKRRGRAPR